MGKHAFNAGAYARAVEWFEESYILAGLENNRTIRQDQVMEFIQHAINMVYLTFLVLWDTAKLVFTQLRVGRY